MTNGFKTTEFWLTLAVLVIGLVLVLTNKLEAPMYWTFATVGGAGYAISRGLAKTEPVYPPDQK